MRRLARGIEKELPEYDTDDDDAPVVRPEFTHGRTTESPAVIRRPPRYTRARVSSSSAESTDPLEVYDDLVMAGEVPDPDEFCSRYPEHPELMKRIEALEALRKELDGIARDLERGVPEWPAEIGGFRLKKRLGQGGMGVVFIGENIATNQACAVKLLQSKSALALERFRREARVIKGLKHPGIPVAYDFGVIHGQAFSRDPV